MKMRFLMGLFAMSIGWCCWAAPNESPAPKPPGDDLGGYTMLDFEADLSTGNFDGAIERMEGNVRITLSSEDPGLEPLPISADEVTFAYPDGDTSMPERILLKGHAVIKHPKATMKADQADWDVATGEVVLTGNPVIDTPTMTGVRGETISINLEQGTWYMTKGRADSVPLAAGGPKGTSADPSLLREADIGDWPGFLALFKKQCVDERPSPGKHILDLFDPEARTLVGSMPVEELVGLKEKFIEKMNVAMRLPEFYDEASWKGAAVSEEAARLAETGRTLAPQERTRVNRLLLEAAYPGWIRPGPQPASSAEEQQPGKP